MESFTFGGKEWIDIHNRFNALSNMRNYRQIKFNLIGNIANDFLSSMILHIDPAKKELTFERPRDCDDEEEAGDDKVEPDESGSDEGNKKGTKKES